MGIPLSQLETGRSGQVVSIATAGPMRQRLLDLGMTPGTRVQRMMSSPIGDPVCYLVRGAQVALRLQDAAQIHITI